MNKANQNNFTYSNKKQDKVFIGTNFFLRRSLPIFQINNTLKQYINRKLNDLESPKNKEKDKDKENFFFKKMIIKKSFNGISKINYRENNFLINSLSVEKLKKISSFQNLSINHNKNNNNNNDNYKYLKSVSYKKKNHISPYTKINEKKIKSYKKDFLIEKSNRIIKFSLSNKIPRIRNINKINVNDLNLSKSNLKEKYNKKNKYKQNNSKEKNYTKKFVRINSGNLKNIIIDNSNYEQSSIIQDNSKNNYLSLSNRTNYKMINKIKTIEIKSDKLGKNKRIKHMKTSNIKDKKNINSNNNSIRNNNNVNMKKSEVKKINKDIKEISYFKKINNNKINNKINNNIKNNFNFHNFGKTETNIKSTYNIHLKNHKILNGYRLYWNFKNDYSKDIDISLISINNKTKHRIRNYKLYPNKTSKNFNDNNNINNIYLNNIQNINNINNKHDYLNNNKNKEEYLTKLEYLENENKILKKEIKESKNRISILENKIEELLDEKNSKENSICPQPTPYVIKYSEDIPNFKYMEKIEKSNSKPIKDENRVIDNNRILNINEIETKKNNVNIKY